MEGSQITRGRGRLRKTMRETIMKVKTGMELGFENQFNSSSISVQPNYSVRDQTN